MADKILYIIRGVPGSGKSTMAHKLSPIVVEADDFMMYNGEYKYDPKKVHYCHKKCFETVENHLKNGEPTVAVANTFIKKSLYEPYVELANKYGYKVIIRKADGNYQNIHNVPNNVVSSMKKRFQECINEEKEVIEERLFPELSDRKYNELLWFTSPNMTANAYTKFFGKEMIADRIPAKYLISLGKSDEVLLNDLVEKHKRLRDANKIRPIADYNDFNEFIKDLNSSNYLSRNDKSNMARSGAKIIKSFGDWDLYAITSWNAAKKYGAGTTWCVTISDSDNYFRKHVGKGNTDTFGGKFNRKLFFVINPEKDRKFAIGVEKSLSHNWYLASVDFYNETDYVFYDYSSSITNISFKDDLSKAFYENMSELDGSDAESYEENESFFVDIMKYIRDEFRLNKEEVLEDMEQLRKDIKQKLGINESANNSTNMTWEEFVEKVGRENEFDGSIVISKNNTSIVIRQSGRILVRTGKTSFKKAYSNLKTFDEIYNMLVEKGFVEEQILTEGINQHSLYHGCDLAYAVSIMIDNAMRGETIANINGKKYQGNSLTRSLQFAKDWQEDRWDGHGDVLNQFWVVLELNKERLKTKYKVLPYNYWEDYFGKDYEHTIDRNGYGDQYEEFVVGRINNLRNYLDDVYLSDECVYGEYAEILAIVKRELELRGEDYSESDIEEALQQLGIDKPSPDDLDVEELDEEIVHAEMNNNDMLVILHNPTRKELKDNHLDDECRIIYDGNNGYYFASSEWTHEQIEQKLQANNLPYTETNGEFYYYQDNLFTTRDDWLSEEEYQEYKNDWYQSLKSMPYIVKNFGNFKVEIFKGEYLSEEIIHAEMINDEMITILKNPSRKELQDNGMMKCRIAQDWDGNFYFADSYDMIHNSIVGKLESKNIKSVETNLFYDTNSNTFYYNVGHLTDNEIEKYSVREEKYLRQSLYISKTFKDFHFKIIFGEL